MIKLDYIISKDDFNRRKAYSYSMNQCHEDRTYAIYKKKDKKVFYGGFGQDRREQYKKEVEEFAEDFFTVDSCYGEDYVLKFDVIPQGAEFYITYPLSKVAVFSICEDQSPKQFLMSIVEAYDIVYNMENQTSTIKEQSIQEASGGKSHLVNRVRTNGMFGIWGHSEADLCMPSIILYNAQFMTEETTDVPPTDDSQNDCSNDSVEQEQEAKDKQIINCKLDTNKSLMIVISCSS